MGKQELYTPVAFIIFNRPRCVRQSFAAIRRAKPKKLFIIADGPRDDHPEDVSLCKECRDIVKNIDWDCDVKRNYSDVNLGCGKRPATGISWVFDQVDRAMILEDDCVPSTSFFYFCQEMLEKYKDDDRIYSVSGMNFGLTSDNEADYYFTHINNTWGWATWRRIWQQYDYEIKSFPQVKENNELLPLMMIQPFADYWYRCFDEVHSGRLKSAWDYQFLFMSFLHQGLHIYPQENMVTYMGFNDMATHCMNIDENNLFSKAAMPAEEISFPLRHPVSIQADYRIDCLTMVHGFGVSPSGRMFCDKISPKVIEEIKQFPRLLIYGAGAVCRDVIEVLSREEIDRFDIVVSDTKGKSQYVMGNLVHGISEYKEQADAAFVLVSATRKHCDEMVRQLKSLGFAHYACVL